ncbi:uncharacterized protein LOC120636270 [Pararge aegeria]|uniref:uncharacterized protein LOC120636270 n=1 Tax=Pararge aegeria TaxID=116150 RepID=UPI0019D277FD|nr:uncharacterized protein LOC120636270 [Pararge aegeria]
MAEEKFEKLIRRRSCMKSKLTIFNNYIKVFQSGGTASNLQLLDLESRFNKFEILYADFDKLQSKIEMLSEDLDEETGERAQFEDQYHRLVATARSLLGTRRPEQAPELRDSSVTSNEDVQVATSSQILLSTALVKVVDSRGDDQPCRILLDNGSTSNFITQSLCGKLGLTRRSANSTVTGINNNTSHITQSCSLIMKSYYNNYSLTVDCFILPQITQALPSSYFEVSNIPLPIGISLADPSFNVPAVIDILVGAEVFWSVLCSNSIYLGKNQPKLYETKLGWLVSGYVARLKAPSSSLFCNFINEKANPDLTRFWELDSVAAEHSLSPEERACEQSFLENTTRKKDGRFVVTMPLKEHPSVLGDSFYKAKCRFLSLERKFLREPVFKDRYIDFMREYERLGHMTENKASANSCADTINYYLPHHSIVRESRWLKTPSTRLKSFVRNRVHEIQDSTKGHTWNYVPSKDNPADLLSRGLKADHISNSRLWWSGPTFLANNESEWPKVPNTNI